MPFQSIRMGAIFVLYRNFLLTLNALVRPVNHLAALYMHSKSQFLTLACVWTFHIHNIRMWTLKLCNSLLWIFVTAYDKYIGFKTHVCGAHTDVKLMCLHSWLEISTPASACFAFLSFSFSVFGNNMLPRESMKMHCFVLTNFCIV